MPDWSYTTVSGPLLRRFDHDRGRRFVNGMFALMAKLPQGFRIVDLLGHMEPGETLATALPSGRELRSPLVLLPCIDPRGRAAAALSRFGFGALVIGPVSVDEAREPLFRRDDEGIVGTGGAALGLSEALSIVDRTGSADHWFELDPFADEQADPEESLGELVAALSERASALVLSPQCHAQLMALAEERRTELLRGFARTCREAGVQPFVGVPLGADDAAGAWSELGLGLYLSGAPLAEGFRWGSASSHEVAVAHAKRAKAAGAYVVADGGSLSPRQVLELIGAGADLVAIGPGLVLTGPGLAKRSNEAYELRRVRDAKVVADFELPVRRPWVWAALLGFAMLFGALLAGWTALTTVLLPYDEEFLGRTAADIAAFNPRVLSFMTHDRITLAGTMVSIGLIYTSLAFNSMRRGERWSQHVVGASATLGFLSFFAFLGFGYLDPFHAFVTAVLLQFLIQVIVRPVGPRRPVASAPSLDNDGAWRRALWGQLCFVVHGGALILAGITILSYGMTVVFVPQDIAYLGCDAHAIEGFDDQLQALIAHDRATFGGMLVSGGMALTLTSMWSFRRGDRWLFWTLALVVFAPYAMTLWIHWDIGYRDHFHLAPVYIGVVLLFVGLALSGPYLLRRASR